MFYKWGAFQEGYFNVSNGIQLLASLSGWSDIIDT